MPWRGTIHSKAHARFLRAQLVFSFEQRGFSEVQTGPSQDGVQASPEGSHHTMNTVLLILTPIFLQHPTDGIFLNALFMGPEEKDLIYQPDSRLERGRLLLFKFFIQTFLPLWPDFKLASLH